MKRGLQFQLTFLTQTAIEPVELFFFVDLFIVALIVF